MKISILSLNDFILVIKLKIVALTGILGEETLHFVLVKADGAVITELAVLDKVGAVLANAVKHCPRLPIF